MASSCGNLKTHKVQNKYRNIYVIILFIREKVVSRQDEKSVIIFKLTGKEGVIVLRVSWVAKRPVATKGYDTNMALSYGILIVSAVTLAFILFSKCGKV